jgi:hypothetical protein
MSRTQQKTAKNRKKTATISKKRRKKLTLAPKKRVPLPFFRYFRGILTEIQSPEAILCIFFVFLGVFSKSQKIIIFESNSTKKRAKKAPKMIKK